MKKLFVKTSYNTWSEPKHILVKTNYQTWSNVAKAYVKTAYNTWSQFFQYTGPAIVIETPVAIYQDGYTMNDSTSVTLTGRKYHWSNADGYTYIWQKSPDNSNWSNIGSATSTTNPSTGTYSDVTKVLSSSDFTSGSDMYFRFKFTATNSTYSTSNVSTSSSVLVSYYGTPMPNSPYPSITGSTTVGNTAYGNIGTWTNSPTSYDYRWYFMSGAISYPLTYSQSRLISNKYLSGYSAAVVTSANHGYKAGDTIVISGMDSLFNNTYTISAKTNNTIYFTISAPTAWASNTSYVVGTYVSYGGNVYICIQNTPPGNTPSISPSYWTIQSFSNTSASGTVVGPNYYEGSTSSSTSYSLTTPSIDYRSGLSMIDKALYFAVKAYNQATLSPSEYSNYKIVYGVPTISFGSPTLSSTSISLPYTSSYMSSYVIDVKYLGVSISTYPKTISSPSSPISITGLTGGRTYSISVTPYNNENTAGSTTTTSQNTTVPVPVNTVPPLVSPTSGTVGITTYSVTDGTWTDSPTSYTYQWKYNDQGPLYLPISGATSSTYSPPSNYFSNYVSPIVCFVTAINAGGSSVPQISSNYATVALPTYTVTYNGNSNTGGSVPTDSTQYNSGNTVTVKSNSGSLTRTGYFTNNWNTQANGLGTSYSNTVPYGTFSISTNIILYAEWRGTVSYNANGATSGSIPTDSTAYLPSSTVTVKTNSGTLAKSGATFNGWNTAADGTGTSYAVSSTFAFSGGVTLYAQWSAISYTITWNPNSGTVSPPSSTGTYGSIITAPIPTLTGNTFLYWRDTLSLFSYLYQINPPNGTWTIAGNITFYAWWSPDTYTIAYNANGGSGAPTSQTKTYNVTLTLSATVPTRSGYTFNGWNTAADGTGTSYAAGGSYTANAGTTLYAKWLIAAPTVITAPTLSASSAYLTHAISVTNGTWANSPTSYTYQWRNNNGIISGATSNTYSPQGSDYTATLLTCTVTATNAGGSASSTPASVSIFISGTLTTTGASNVYTFNDSVTQTVTYYYGISANNGAAPTATLPTQGSTSFTISWGSTAAGGSAGPVASVSVGTATRKISFVAVITDSSSKNYFALHTGTAATPFTTG